jgi:hypothetical protein
MPDISHLRPKVEIVKALVEKNTICNGLYFDWHDLSAEVESLTQREGKSGFGFGYHDRIKSNGKHVFFVEKWKINENIELDPILGHADSFQDNQTYFYKPDEDSLNPSKLKVLEDVDDETIANQVIQFILDNLHLT